MDALIVAVCEYLRLLHSGRGCHHLALPPPTGQGGYGGADDRGGVIMVVLIKFGAAIYTDPRPFVVDSSVKALLLTTGSPLTTPHWLRRSPSW